MQAPSPNHDSVPHVAEPEQKSNQPPLQSNVREIRYNLIPTKNDDESTTVSPAVPPTAASAIEQIFNDVVVEFWKLIKHTQEEYDMFTQIFCMSSVFDSHKQLSTKHRFGVGKYRINKNRIMYHCETILLSIRDYLRLRHIVQSKSQNITINRYVERLINLPMFTITPLVNYGQSNVFFKNVKDVNEDIFDHEAILSYITSFARSSDMLYSNEAMQYLSDTIVDLTILIAWRKINLAISVIANDIVAESPEIELSHKRKTVTNNIVVDFDAHISSIVCTYSGMDESPVSWSPACSCDVKLNKQCEHCRKKVTALYDMVARGFKNSLAFTELNDAIINFCTEFDKKYICGAAITQADNDAIAWRIENDAELRRKLVSIRPFIFFPNRRAADAATTAPPPQGTLRICLPYEVYEKYSKEIATATSDNSVTSNDTTLKCAHF